MFERILIKSGSNAMERFLSIADVVDMMFYYGEVHIVVSQFELKQLLAVFGEDVLFELISSKRLIIHPCDQHIGAVRQGELESVGIFRHNFRTIDELLFNFHKEVIDDNVNNKRFADKFSKVLNIYLYPSAIQESLYKDVENAELLSRVTQVFIRQYYSNYKGIEDIRVNATLAASTYVGLYNIDGNLRLNELNSIHRRLGYHGNFSYSTVLMALGETHLDCYLASELQAEMIANNRWSEIYKLRMNECIRKAEGNRDNIDHFREMTVNNFLSPGESFACGLISSQELLKDLFSKDSVKFREWLSNISDGLPLTGELYKEIQNVNSNKPWVKLTRSLSQLITSALNPILGGFHTFLDGFVGDKLVNGWKPSIFVSNILAKDKYKK